MAFTLRRHIGTVAFTAALAALTLPVLAQPTPVPASAEANATANGPRQAGEHGITGDTGRGWRDIPPDPGRRQRRRRRR